MGAAQPVVPEVPVEVAVAVLVLAALLWRLHRRHALTAPRALVALAAAVYAAGLLGSVLLPFPVVVGSARAGMAPWHAYLQLVPFYDHDPVGYLLNVALFVPLGVLLPLVGRVATWPRAMATGFVVSLAVEVVQLALVLSVTSGRVADVDDLIANTLGTVVGFAALRVAQRSRLVARWTTSASFTPAATGRRPRTPASRPARWRS